MHCVRHAVAAFMLGGRLWIDTLRPPPPPLPPQVNPRNLERMRQLKGRMSALYAKVDTVRGGVRQGGSGLRRRRRGRAGNG